MGARHGALRRLPVADVAHTQLSVYSGGAGHAMPTGALLQCAAVCSVACAVACASCMRCRVRCCMRCCMRCRVCAAACAAACAVACAAACAVVCAAACAVVCNVACVFLSGRRHVFALALVHMPLLPVAIYVVSAYVTHGVFPNQTWRRFKADKGGETGGEG
eukprot:334717-Chlamydomonas_euryale.AAC.1